MFARIVEFSPVSDAAAQFVQVIQQTALGIVESQTGCVAAFVELPQCAGRAVLGVSVWKSEAHAEQFSRECYRQIENLLRPFLICRPRLHTFEVRGIDEVILRVSAMTRKDSSQAQAAGM